MNFRLYVYLIQIQLFYFVYMYHTDDALHGIIFQKDADSIVVHYYHYVYPNLHKNIDGRITHSNFLCPSPNNVHCESLLFKTTEFKFIPKDMIFFKEFIEVKFAIGLNQNELDILIEKDTLFANQFLRFSNMPTVQIENISTYDILVFSYTNIIIEKRLISPALTMIYTKDVFFLGFLAQDTQNLPQELINHVEYDDKHYLVVAHTFICANSHELAQIIEWNLIKNANDITEIFHPCIPDKNRIIYRTKQFISPCLDDLNIYPNVTFIGSFNEKECQMLIRDALTKGLNHKEKLKTTNLFDVKLPIKLDYIEEVHLITDLLNTMDLENAKKQGQFKKTQDVLCDPNKNILNIDQCFEIQYLRFLLTDVLNLKAKDLYTSNFLIDIDTYTLIYSDPRLGIKIVNKKESFSSKMLSSSEILSSKYKLTLRPPIKLPSRAKKSFREVTDSMVINSAQIQTVPSIISQNSSFIVEKLNILTTEIASNVVSIQISTESCQSSAVTPTAPTATVFSQLIKVALVVVIFAILLWISITSHIFKESNKQQVEPEI